MTLKTMFEHIFEQKPASPRVAMAYRARHNGFDVKSLKRTRPLTEAEKAERYRSGRFAEMTDVQAGL